jgi:pyruvate/2-oxoglutarate dehydrogenase complex dihydrolipoamide acyltransferase (E2) component
MDARLYDVYLTGKLAEGLGREQAAERLAQLFKTAPATMLGLLTGKPQLLKRGVDKDTALKYREALQRVGVESAFKPQAVAQAEAAAPPAPQPATAQPQARAPAAPQTTATITPAAAASANTGALSLAPAGADVLAPGERQRIEPAHIELGHLSVAEAGAPLDELPRDLGAPVNPDTGHLSLSAADGDLLTEEERTALPVSAPDTDHLSLAPAGTDLETLHETKPPVEVDISQLSIAPAGSELLTPEQRRKFDEVAPDTGNLRLAP